MKRETSRLAGAAARVEADLRRTTGEPWTCSIGSDYVLEVSNGTRSVELLLESDVEDAEWFAPGEASPAEVDGGLAADADELLATEVGEAVRTLGLDWPVCRNHSRLMGACSGWWYCNGEPYHDVAEVGLLPRADVPSADPR